MIKLLAIIYRTTGWYCPLAEIYEYRAIKKAFPSISDGYAANGFTRAVKIK